MGMSSAAVALGLGPVELQSRRGEPLEAVIPVHGVTATDAALVSAFVADPADFDRLGARRSVVARLLRLVTVTDGDRVAIRASTLQPVREPEIDLVVEVTYRRTRLVQRYRLSLDASGRAAPRPRASAPGTAGEPPSAHGGPRRYGPVQATDTLWSLARRLRPAPGISIEQMMVALVRANPAAFAGRRFDGLRRGSYLTVPGPDAILRTDPETARRLVGRGALPSP